MSTHFQGGLRVNNRTQIYPVFTVTQPQTTGVAVCTAKCIDDKLQGIENNVSQIVGDLDRTVPPTKRMSIALPGEYQKNGMSHLKMKTFVFTSHCFFPTVFVVVVVVVVVVFLNGQAKLANIPSLKPCSHWINILGNFTMTPGNIPMG